MPKTHFIDLNALKVEDWDKLVSLAIQMRENPGEYHEYCRGKILATLFYEPSTRTQFSFQSAMYRLGGQVIGFDNPGTTSISKGESLKDTIRMLGGYADIIAIRHPLDGAAMAASITSDIPIINAGDGGHLHPTQTLTDLVTLAVEKGGFDNHCIGICGDLRYGRTVHSLIKALSCFRGNSFVLISTKELTVPPYVKEVLDKSGCRYTYADTLEEAMPLLDVLYMTRIQRERFSSPEEYEAQKGIYILDGEKMKRAKDDMIVMHPLPRVDEITTEVDNAPRAAYFRQARNGVFARMALIYTMLEGSLCGGDLTEGAFEIKDKRCRNKRCIKAFEYNLPDLAYDSHEGTVCGFCEQPVM